MKVRVTYIDNDSFSKEEATEQAKHIFGSNVEVETLPNNSGATAFIAHGIRTLISMRQLNEYFDGAYQERKPIIRQEALAILEDILDSVLEANEAKLLE